MYKSTSRPTFGYALVADDALQALEHGVLAEKCGFDTVWSPDHLVDVNGDKTEPWSVLSAIAARTKKIELASSVTDTQRCHPARTAHSVACLDAISHGRAILGIGAGEAMNIVPYGIEWEPPRERCLRLAEAIQVIRLLWTSSRKEPVDFTGTFYNLDRAFLSQRAAQKPYPPIYVGAMGSKRALQIVGKYADGWHAWLNTPDTFKKRWSIIKEAAESAGRSPKQIRATSHIMVAFPRSPSENKAALLAGKALLVAEKNTLRELGYDTQLDHYQNLDVSKESIVRITKAAEQVPEDAVYRVLAIRGSDDIEERAEELAKAGVTHFVIADLLAPKSVNYTLKLFRRIIRRYSG